MVTYMLKGDVQIWNKPGIICHKGEEFIIDPGGVEIQKSYPGNISFSKNLLQQNKEIYLFPPVQPIGKKVLGNEGEFFHSQSIQPARLGSEV
jgi:hypothetical protein